MRVFDELKEDNFVPYAQHSYNNQQCLDISEFYDDLARFKYIKRLLRKYNQTGEVQERLVLNHLIILYNVFGIEPANKMLFFRLEKELWSPLKTFLVYLNYLPEHEKVEIPIDLSIAAILRKI